MLQNPTTHTKEQKAIAIKSAIYTLISMAVIVIVVIFTLPAYMSPFLRIGTLSFIGSQSRVWFFCFSAALSAALIFNLGLLTHKLGIKSNAINLSLIIFVFLNIGLSLAQATVIDYTVAWEHNIIAGVFTAHAVICIFLYALIILIKKGLKRAPWVVFCLTPLLAVGGLNIFIWFGVYGHTIAFYQAALLFTALLTVFLMQVGEPYLERQHKLHDGYIHKEGCLSPFVFNQGEGGRNCEDAERRVQGSRRGGILLVEGRGGHQSPVCNDINTPTILPNETASKFIIQLNTIKKIASILICFLFVLITVILTYEAYLSHQLHINTLSSFGERNRDWFLVFSIALSVSLIINLNTLLNKLPFKRNGVKYIYLAFLAFNIVLALLQAYIIDWAFHRQHIALAAAFTAHGLLCIFIFMGLVIKFGGIKRVIWVTVLLIPMLVIGALNFRMIYLMGGLINFYQIQMVYASLVAVFLLQSWTPSANETNEAKYIV